MRRTALLAAAALVAGPLAVSAAPPASADVRTVSNPLPIAPADQASTFRSLTVSGLGPVTDVNVTLNDVEHGHPSDLDIYLISPGGTAVPILSDGCGPNDITGRDLTFDDEAAATAGACASGTYRPTDVDLEPDPDSAPDDVALATSLSAFDGQNPNGAWQVVAYDDQANDTGSVAGGFSITITTGPAAIVVPANDGNSDGPGTPYPYPINVTSPGSVTDVDLVLSGVSHTYVDDLQVLLVNPAGGKALVLSEACDEATVVNATWTFDDAAGATFPDDTPSCASGTWKPSSYDAPALPAPAPAAPYATTLGALNGAPAAGTWLLYVADTAAGDGGYITGVQLRVATDAPPETTIIARPKRSTTKRTATIAFTSTVFGADKAVSYQCKVDRKKWRSCSSPLRLTRLTAGKHKVRVRAVDGSGKLDPTPAVTRWKVRP